jgi:uncharacterized membrane protein (UPF0182 family)
MEHTNCTWMNLSSLLISIVGYERVYQIEILTSIAYHLFLFIIVYHALFYSLTEEEINSNI